MNLKRNILFIFIIFFSCSNVFSQDKSITLEKAGILNVDLQKVYPYAGFEANKETLTWMRLSRQEVKVSFYKISTSKSESIKLRNGRGPNEFQTIMGSKLINDKLYLLDSKNAKLIPINTKLKISKDIILSFSTPYRLSSYNDQLVVMDIVNPENVFHLFNPQTQDSEIVRNGDLDPVKEFKNITYKEGYITVAGSKLIHLTRYKPSIYVYDLNKRKYLKKN